MYTPNGEKHWKNFEAKSSGYWEMDKSHFIKVGWPSETTIIEIERKSQKLMNFDIKVTQLFLRKVILTIYNTVEPR